MSWSMQRVTWVRLRRAAAALVVTFALLFPLTCVTGPNTTVAQQVCCTAMGHECDSMTPPDCCSIEVRQVDEFAVTKKITLNARAEGVTSTAIVEQIVDISLPVKVRMLDDACRRPRSTPTYLLSSALLI